MNRRTWAWAAVLGGIVFGLRNIHLRLDMDAIIEAVREGRQPAATSDAEWFLIVAAQVGFLALLVAWTLHVYHPDRAREALALAATGAVAGPIPAIVAWTTLLVGVQSDALALTRFILSGLAWIAFLATSTFVLWRARLVSPPIGAVGVAATVLALVALPAVVEPTRPQPAWLAWSAILTSTAWLVLASASMLRSRPALEAGKALHDESPLGRTSE